ncbi:protease SohB [Neptunomonas japonica]|uniref:Serine protease SohB n=1 Tax=Neptunomonas japonica JAMM 1380 TaxID=1441457 RepID=A0A7R6PH45_9GAMM|nr:protease SohB [Neptunomonas japonica]BBB30112.1 serine protease SohB [Neptunomonas japonica JAMM 1380]
MSEFFFEYGLFAAKAFTGLVVVLLLVAGIIMVSARNRRDDGDGEVDVTSINDLYEDMKDTVEAAVLDKDAYKQLLKQQKKQDKLESKQRKKEAKTASIKEPEDKKRIYVLDFDGDIKASEVELLREEISAVLTFARPCDEVVIRLESAGGMVHTYGLAASQLARIKASGIPLTVCVDQVAASGGYLMACLADRLIAAPFALVGSIGVIAQVPNFNRVLKKHDVDYEMFTAGEYKRTVTMFGENTEKGKQKFVEELEDTHALFKEFVSEYRPQLNIEKVATGEVWFGKRALAEELIDELSTSDDYLMTACNEADVFRVRYEMKKTLQERLSEMAIQTSEGIVSKIWTRVSNSRFMTR